MLTARTLRHSYFRPRPPLDAFVDYIQISIGSCVSGDPVRVTTLVRPYCRLSIKFGAPIFWRRSARVARTPSCALIGINATPYQAIAEGDIGVVLVGFKPWAVRCFFDADLAGLRDAMMPLSRIPGRVGAADAGRVSVRAAGALDDRNTEHIVAHVEEFLRARLRSGQRDGAVERAVELVVERAGAVTIEELARVCCLGARQLRRRFRRAVGTGPKAFARIVRFHRALALASEEREWSRIALVAGYSDLSHLDREFRRFAHASPTKLIAGGRPEGWVADTLERNARSSATSGPQPAALRHIPSRSSTSRVARCPSSRK
jgi:AraC-like DNA-binding protein